MCNGSSDSYLGSATFHMVSWYTHPTRKLTPGCCTAVHTSTFQAVSIWQESSEEHSGGRLQVLYSEQSKRSKRKIQSITALEEKDNLIVWNKRDGGKP